MELTFVWVRVSIEKGRSKWKQVLAVDSKYKRAHIMLLSYPTKLITPEVFVVQKS